MQIKYPCDYCTRTQKCAGSVQVCAEYYLWLVATWRSIQKMFGVV